MIFKVKSKKIIIILIGIAWILTGIFISFSLLKINLRDPAFPKYPDKLGLGVLWSSTAVAICIILTSIINRALSNEKRIEKNILKSAMYGAGFIALGIWVIQLIIFEGYLHRGMKITIITQDIRVLFIIVAGIYVTIFFNLLEGKLLPESGDKSSKKVKELLVSELGKLISQVTDSYSKLQMRTLKLKHQIKSQRLSYHEITFRHVDVMGSGRFFYAEKNPLETVLEL